MLCVLLTFKWRLWGLFQDDMLVRSGYQASRKRTIEDRDLDPRVIARNLG
jgi:hypothetical protein